MLEKFRKLRYELSLLIVAIMKRISLTLLVLVLIVPAHFALLAEPDTELDKEVIEFIQRKFPDIRKDMEVLYEQNPQAYQDTFANLRAIYLQYEQIRAADPDGAKAYVERLTLQDKAERIAQTYGDASDFKEKQKIEARLTEIYNRMFELSLEELEGEAESLQTRLFDVQEQINYRRNHQDDLVRRRVIERVSRFDDAMDW